MAIVQSGVTTGNSGTSQPASIPVTFPAGAAAGHVALVEVHTPPGAATVTDPTGWTVLANGDGGNSKLGWWLKTLDAADLTAGGVTITRSAGSSHSWVCETYSGTTGLDAISAQQATTTGTTAPFFPAVTPVAANCLRIGVCAGRVVTAATPATASPPASWTETGESIDAHATNQRRLLFSDRIQLSGQAGVPQGTATATTDQSVTYQSYSLTLAPLTVVTADAGVAAGTGVAPDATVSIAGGGIPGFAQGFTLPPFGTLAVVVPPPAPPVVTTEGPRPIVELGFTVGSPVIGNVLHWDDPTRGYWDTNTWAAEDLWVDVTPWLQSFSTQRGANRVEGPILRYEAGTATVTLLNNDRRFDPTNLAGPYVSGGVTQVRPMLQLRIRSSYAGTAYPDFTGYVDAVALHRPYPDLSQAVFTATDAQKVLGSHNRTALESPVGAGETSGQRVNRILDSVGWPALDRIVGGGASTLQGTTMDSDAWTELLLVQDSEIGEVFVDATGKVVFRGRNNIFTRPASVTSQATFGRFGEAGELPYVAVTPEYDDTTVRNLVRIARVGGTQQVAQDAESQTKYLVRTHDRTDLLLQTDEECLAYAQFVLAQVKDAELRLAQITINPMAQPAELFPQCFGRDFGDRITIRARPPGGGLLEQDCLIRGIEQTYGGTNRWQTTWTLQAAEHWAFLAWDSGRWDTAKWSW